MARLAPLIIIALLAIFSISECSAQAKAGCPGVCPALFQPVCGKMGNKFKTFSNRCTLDLANKCKGGRWSVVKNGSC